MEAVSNHQKKILLLTTTKSLKNAMESVTKVLLTFCSLFCLINPPSRRSFTLLLTKKVMFSTKIRQFRALIFLAYFAFSDLFFVYIVFRLGYISCYARHARKMNCRSEERRVGKECNNRW